jgi:ADP-heptose:LPS heptosyltransferase
VLLHDLLLAIAPDLGPPSPPRIQVPLRSLAIAHRACVRHGLDEERRVVGIHPGGRRGKRWDSARFDQVAAELERRGIVVVVLTGPAERPLLAGMGPPGPQRIYAPPLDLEGLRGFLAGLDAFLSGDSGPMHLAAALGVPCVSVFRVPDYPRYAPLGPEHRVLFDPRGDLAPGAVAAAVIEVLQAGTAPRRQGTALRRQGTGPRRQLSRMTAAPHR